MRALHHLQENEAILKKIRRKCRKICFCSILLHYWWLEHFRAKKILAPPTLLTERMIVVIAVESS